MKTLFRSAALSVLILAGAADAGRAQTVSAADSQFRATTLSLSAFGETRIAPDMASISLGVTTDAPSAAQAMAANRERMSQVINALKRQGVADRDIQTSNLSLNAQYAYDQNKPPRLTGYQAANQVTITVDDLPRLGGVIDTVVSVGANQVNGVSFGLKYPQAAEDAARLSAVKALQAKADLYAQATGYRIGRLVTLSEGGGYAQPQPMYRLTAMAAAPASTPVEGGELKIRIDVSGLYELTR